MLAQRGVPERHQRPLGVSLVRKWRRIMSGRAVSSLRARIRNASTKVLLGVVPEGPPALRMVAVRVVVGYPRASTLLMAARHTRNRTGLCTRCFVASTDSPTA